MPLIQRPNLFKTPLNWLPYGIGILALICTIIATIYTAEAAKEKSKAQFEEAIDALQDAINDRVKIYNAVLRSTAGLFVTMPSINREQFKNYVENLDLATNYPGSLGIGYSIKISESEMSALIRNMQHQDIKDFQVWPVFKRPEYHAVIYREPLTERNRRVFGYDMSTNPIRWKAMEHARDTGLPTATGKIDLIQEMGEEKKFPGLIIFLPVYKNAGALNDTLKRREALKGFLYFSVRIRDFLDKILVNSNYDSLIEFEIYDRNSVSEEHLMYRSRKSDTPYQAQFTGSKTMEVNNRQWILNFSSTQTMDQSIDYSQPWQVFFFGLSTSFLLFGITLLQVRGRIASEKASQSLRQSQHALEDQTQILTTVNDINTQIAAELDLEKLVKTVTDASVKLTGAQFGMFFYNAIGKDDESYMLYTLSGTAPELFNKMPMAQVTKIFSPIFHSEGIVRIDDIRKDSFHGKDESYNLLTKDLPACSYLAVPVISRSGEVIGGLFFGHELPGVFTIQSEQIAAGIATQAAVAIDNARLYQSAQNEIIERKRAENLLAAQKQALELVAQGKALPTILNALTQIVEQFGKEEFISILTIDPDSLRLRHAAVRNLPEIYCRAIDGIIIGPGAASFGACAYKKETVITSDIATDSLWEKYRELAIENGLRSCWAVPIISTQGKVLGTFAIYHSTPYSPSADELELVSILANTAAIPIERQIGQGALQESEERLRLALSAAEMGTWRVDLQTSLNTRDAVLNKILGLDTIETTQPLYDSIQRIHFEDRLSIEKMINAVVKNHGVYDAEYRISRPNGEIRWVRDKGKLIRDSDDNPIYLTGTVVDITEQKQIEEALHEAEERLRLALDAGQFGVWDWDIVNNYITRSERLLEIYGLASNEFGGRLEDLSNLIHPEDQSNFVEAIKLALSDKKPYQIEFRVQPKSGQLRWLYVRGQVFYDLDGAPIRMLGVILDITQRKMVEEELQKQHEHLEEIITKRTAELRDLSGHLQTVREEEKAIIAREIHDELGSTLTALKIDLAWVSNKISNENPSTKEKISSLLSLVDSAIQSTRRIQSELRPTVLDDLGLIAAIKWQASEFQKRTGIKCELDLPESKPPLLPAVRLALFRILQETLTNVARHSSAKNVNVFFSANREAVTLIISDDGKGIELEQTRSAGKYGIRGILERAHYLGGEVNISGQKGKGTSITVTIPISQQAVKRRSTDIVAS